ncbi:DNA repair metallo-beta-lactamase [Pyrenophora tritici-repentis]|nr:DNA repair metallo-beta-lactamase [Pyrenophora tritici-repentis]
MSTFRGIVAEFPRIRIDYFRQQPEYKPPLTCFLSHVHSDHLAGLESLRAPFVCCSAATKEILLRLEKFHYSMNFTKGILESRNVTYDRSMRKLAKALPLDTPTEIELAPGNTIRVTLIDANHCVGAVMFLIEGKGEIVLYTGDIRAETWWVNSLVQNPVLLPYTLGNLRLDCVYLDTTFATKKMPYREFPSKAEGIRELLSKVDEYPDDTIFYFHSWTFGYENIWVALSTYLGSRIHLDDYRARIYGSLSTLDKRGLREAGLDVPMSNKSLRESGLEIREAPALCGLRNGNRIQPGCLTSKENVRIHSCEHRMGCDVMDKEKDNKVVHIIPIITHADGSEIAEIGAGGGKGDLDQKEELETGGTAEVGKLMELCAASISDENTLGEVLALLQQALGENGKLDLDVHLQKQSEDTQDDLTLQSLVSVLSGHASNSIPERYPNRTIRFPYSRHSSYSKLRELIKVFRPIYIFPYTVDEKTWTPEVSMESLFGDLCHVQLFRHDAEMVELHKTRIARESRKRSRDDSQVDTQTTEDEITSPFVTGMSTSIKSLECEGPVTPNVITSAVDMTASSGRQVSTTLPPTVTVLEPEHVPNDEMVTEDPKPTPVPLLSVSTTTISKDLSVSISVPSITVTPTPSKGRRKKLQNKQIAGFAARRSYGLNWSDIELISTRSKADQEELEL